MLIKNYKDTIPAVHNLTYSNVLKKYKIEINILPYYLVHRCSTLGLFLRINFNISKRINFTINIRINCV